MQSVKCAIGLFFAFLITGVVHAKIIQEVVIFGDSLSDSGNLFLATGQPGAPYFNGRLSNGFVYADHINSLLGLAPMMPSLAGGTNYAVAGTRAYGDVPFGAGVIPGAQAQFDQYFGTLDPSDNLNQTLHIVFLGSNDVSDALDSGLDSASASMFLLNSAQKVAAGILALDNAGASNIVIPTVPDLGLSPEYYGQVKASEYTKVFNQHLQNLLAGVSTNPLTFFDTTDFIKRISSDFLVTDEACLTQNGLCQNPEEYLFFDYNHPSAAVHLAFSAAITAVAVSIAPTWILMLVAMLFMGASWCRRQDKS